MNDVQSQLSKKIDDGVSLANNNVSIRRIELDSLVKEFREYLGEKNWCFYYSNLCKFLLGKLSFQEFKQGTLDKYVGMKELKYKFTRYHNKFLIANLANAFRDSPNQSSVSAEGYGYLNTLTTKNKLKNLKSMNSNDIDEHEKLKKTIMSLSGKERRRLRDISKNVSPQINQMHKRYKMGEVNAEKYELIPKIPAGINSGNSAVNGDAKGKSAINGQKAAGEDDKGKGNKLPDVTNKKLKGKNLNQLSIKVKDAKDAKNLNLMKTPSSSNTPTSANPNGGNVTTWTQEVMGGIQTLLSSESYELPDSNVLKSRMVGIMREHGLMGNLNDQAINIMILGLENYLKNVLETVIDSVRYRKFKHGNENLDEFMASLEDSEQGRKDEIDRKRRIVLTTEDMYDSFKLVPHVIEPNGMIDRISSVLLKDQDYYKFDTVNKTGIIDLLKINQLELEDPQYLKKRKLNNDDVNVINHFQTYAREPIEQVVAENDKTKEPAATTNEGTNEELLWLIHDLLT